MTTRRELLSGALGALGAAGAERGIAPGVTFVEGPANGLLLRRGVKTLVVYGDPRAKAAVPEMVLFTHHRREAVWAGAALVARGARAVVPAGERTLFEDPAGTWREFATKTRYHDYAVQTSKFPVDAVPVARAVRGGERIDWEGWRIETLATPGYTRGAVSYLLEADGKRIACSGDLIYGEGQILDIYSLQDAMPDLKIRGYHGWATRSSDVIASLRAVAAWKPDLLAPAHGPLITNPGAAIALLIRRLQDLYANYLYTDAGRHYFGEASYRSRAERVCGRAVEPMPPAHIVSREPPAWMKQVGNSRIVFSESGGALLFDCGYAKLREEVRALVAQGRIKRLEGIHISHYHDDHTDEAARASEEFNCPVYTSREMRPILAEPARYRMPCLTTAPISRLEVWPEGERRRWHEYALTRFYFPGQTLYHDAILVEKDGGERILFAGDSFTPTGLDDYCLLNRNLLAPGRGYFYCLDLIARLKPDALLNQHIGLLFRYDDGHLERMRRSLERRRAMLAELLPWDDPNYGLDEQWARFDPYSQESRAGDGVEIAVTVLNHSPRERAFTVTPRPPAGWPAAPPVTVRASAGQEGSGRLRVRIPEKAEGLHVITADIRFAGHDLRQWFEALVDVKAR